MWNETGSLARWGRAAWPRWGGLVTGALFLLTGYLFTWQRGFYWDDYYNKDLAVDLISGEHRPAFNRYYTWCFPARLLHTQLNQTLAGLLPEREFAARLLCTIGVGAGALLLGLLVYRLLASRLAGLVSGWLFLMPCQAPEAVLWLGAAGYILGSVCALLFLHSAVTALARPREAALWCLATVLLFVPVLLAVEQFLVVAGLLPVLAIVIGSRARPALYRRRCARALLLLAAAVALAVAWYFVAYRGATWLSAERKSLSVAPQALWHQAVLAIEQARQICADPWQHSVRWAALALGWHKLAGSLAGWLLLGSAGAALVATVLTWRPATPAPGVRTRVGLLVYLAGALLFVQALLFPISLIAGQQVAPRMLYLPSAGACLCAGAFAWLAAKLIPDRRWERLLVGAAGTLLAASSVGMLGFAVAFAERYQLDRRELAAFRRAVPGDLLPEGRITVVPFALPGRLFGRDDEISRYLLGVFEWKSGAKALKGIFAREGFELITMNRWGGMVFTSGSTPAEPATALAVQGTPVDPARTILFTIRDDRAWVARRLVLRGRNEHEVVFEFPLAQSLQARGTPTFDLDVPEDVPVFDCRLPDHSPAG